MHMPTNSTGAVFFNMSNLIHNTKKNYKCFALEFGHPPRPRGTSNTRGGGGQKADKTDEIGAKVYKTGGKAPENIPLTD